MEYITRMNITMINPHSTCPQIGYNMRNTSTYLIPFKFIYIKLVPYCNIRESQNIVSIIYM